MQPRYTNGIVNLVNSVLKAGGAATHYQPLGALPPHELEEGCVMLLIDGMGSSLIDGTWLEEQKRADINSNFPSETAACIPTFHTGLAPKEHGITGWFMYAKELGSVVTTLPMSLASEELYFSYDAVEAMYDHDTVYEKVGFDCHVVTTEDLAESAYSECHNAGASIHGCEDLTTFFQRIEELAEQGTYVHAYWPDLDTVLHENGIGEESQELLERIDDHASQLAVEVPVIATADHGMTEAESIDITDFPELYDTLLLPTCGMSRTVYCYVKHGRAEEFETLAREKIGHACEIRKSQELLASGYFGTGTAHPNIDERIGDYTLLMDDGYAVVEDAEPLAGVHGGLSEEEMHVPLITF